MKTVIEMAREVYGEHTLWAGPQLERIERFAELVRADERKAMMQLFTDPENQPTQYGTVTVEYMNREIAAEREALGKLDWTAIMREGGLVTWGDASELGDRVLDILRNRGNT